MIYDIFHVKITLEVRGKKQVSYENEHCYVDIKLHTTGTYKTKI